jgi:hypothetical protein
MEKKIIIYENDLKFMAKSDLSSNNIEFASDDIKHKSILNLNTFQYRIQDAAKVNFTMIDFSNLDLENIRGIFDQQCYNNCEMLFLNNNKLSGTINLTNFKKLKIIDVQHNMIDELILPPTIIELTANNNNLQKIQSNLDELERLIINNNKITMIENYVKLELLECVSNNIITLDSCPRLKKIIASENPLKNIIPYILLSYLDIAECPIDVIPIFPNLKHLVASNTQLTDLDPKMSNLEFIEIIGTPIKRLSYFENFDIILCSYGLTKNISSKYKNISNAIINVKNNSIVSISKNLSFH